MKNELFSHQHFILEIKKIENNKFSRSCLIQKSLENSICDPILENQS